MMRQDSVFDWPVRVYYEDTDAGGIVFYANYLRFFERARTEYLRSLGAAQHELKEQTGLMFVVKLCQLDYVAPARLDDELRLGLRISQIGRASLTFAQSAWRGEQLLVSAEVKVVCVQSLSMKPQAIPEFIVRQLQSPV